MKTLSLLSELLQRPSMEFLQALVLAMIAHEIINVLAAARKKGEAPSLRKYFADVANQWQVLLTIVTSAIGFLARHEIMTIAAVQEYPILTGAGIGALSAFLFNKLLDVTKRKVSNTATTLSDEDPEG